MRELVIYEFAIYCDSVLFVLNNSRHQSIANNHNCSILISFKKPSLEEL